MYVCPCVHVYHTGHTRVCEPMQAYMLDHACVFVCTRAHKCMSVRACVCVSARTFVSVCLYVSLSVYTTELDALQIFVFKSIQFTLNVAVDTGSSFLIL